MLIVTQFIFFPLCFSTKNSLHCGCFWLKSIIICLINTTAADMVSQYHVIFVKMHIFLSYYAQTTAGSPSDHERIMHKCMIRSWYIFLWYIFPNCYWFSLIFIEFHWFSMIFNDFWWFFIDFRCFFDDFLMIFSNLALLRPHFLFKVIVFYVRIWYLLQNCS